MAVFAEPDEDVQLIRELVRLGPQGLGHSKHGIEFAQQAFGLGAVLEGDHPTQPTAFACDDWHSVGDNDPVTNEQEMVIALQFAKDNRREAALWKEIANRLADSIVRQPEQLSRGVVRDYEPFASVNTEQSLTDAVKHRLTLLEEARNLVELEA